MMEYYISIKIMIAWARKLYIHKNTQPKQKEKKMQKTHVKM